MSDIPLQLFENILRNCINIQENDLKEYDGAWHVRINDQWRLTFKWGVSGPYDVLIEDPH